MPRPYRGRELVTYREDCGVPQRLDQRARDEGLLDEQGRPNRSELLRRMRDYAERNMPAGYEPPTAGQGS